MVSRDKRVGHINRFTLVELIIASAVGLLVIIGAVTFSLSSLQSLKSLEAEADMRQQGALAVEQFKTDLAFSASEKMILAPNLNSAAAVSFPILKRTDHSSAPATTDEIDWTHTVIYHARLNADGTSDLCRTIFSDRDNTVTDAARLAQANQVLADGTGKKALNGSKSSTIVLVQNISDFSIGKGSKTINARGSGEDPVLTQIGYARLSAGTHTFRFETADADNTKQNIGIDALYLTPAGGAIDGEIMAANSTNSGGTVSVNSPTPAYKWKNNTQLLLSTTSPKAFVQFDVHNDMWMESEFARKNAFTAGTSVTTEPTADNQVAVKLDGMKNTWTVEQQIDAERVPAPVKAPLNFADKIIRLPINHRLDGKDCVVSFTGQGGHDGGGTFARTRIVSAKLVRRDTSWPGSPVTFGGNAGVTLYDQTTLIKSDPVPLQTSAADYVLILQLDPDSAPFYNAPFMKDGKTGLYFRDDPSQSDPDQWRECSQFPLLASLEVRKHDGSKASWSVTDVLDGDRDPGLITGPVYFANRWVVLHIYGDPTIPNSVISKCCKITLAGAGLSRLSFDNNGNLIGNGRSARTKVAGLWIKDDSVGTWQRFTFNSFSWLDTIIKHLTLSDTATPSDWINFEYDPQKNYTLAIRTSTDSAPYYMAPHMLDGKTGVDVSPIWGNWISLAECPLVINVFGSYPESGTYVSRIFDTKLSAPEYATVYGAMSQVLDGRKIQVKVRSGSDPGLTDAPDWADVTAQELSVSPATLTGVATKRYVQFMAILNSVGPNFDVSPALRTMVITWPGTEKIVDLSGIFTHGPDYGKFIIYMDGTPLNTVNTFINFKMTRNIRNQTITKSFHISSGSHQIEGDWTL